jgi:hypothetical protein
MSDLSSDPGTLWKGSWTATPRSSNSTEYSMATSRMNSDMEDEAAMRTFPPFSWNWRMDAGVSCLLRFEPMCL